jgi:hypothetical protein
MADSIKDAWTLGLIAGSNGWPASDNPYPTGSPRAESWQAGQLMGRELCQPSPTPIFKDKAGKGRP